MSHQHPTSGSRAAGPLGDALRRLQALVVQQRQAHGHLHVPSWFMPSVCASELNVTQLLEHAALAANDDGGGNHTHTHTHTHTITHTITHTHTRTLSLDRSPSRGLVC